MKNLFVLCLSMSFIIATCSVVPGVTEEPAFDSGPTVSTYGKCGPDEDEGTTMKHCRSGEDSTRLCCRTEAVGILPGCVDTYFNKCLDYKGNKECLSIYDCNDWEVCSDYKCKAIFCDNGSCMPGYRCIMHPYGGLQKVCTKDPR